MAGGFYKRNKVRTKQPQEFVLPNSAIGCILAESFANPKPTTVITNIDYAAFPRATGRLGYQIVADASASSAIATVNFRKISTRFSLVWAGVQNATSATWGTVCETDYATSATNPFFLRQNGNASLGGNATTWCAGALSTGNNRGVVSFPTPPVGVPIVVVVNYNLKLTGYSCIESVYVNGVKQVLTGGLNGKGSTTETTTNNLYVHADATPANRASVSTAMVGIVNDNAEIAQSLSINPWQIFAPERKMLYAPTAAAGGFKPYWAMGSNQVIQGNGVQA